MTRTLFYIAKLSLSAVAIWLTFLLCCWLENLHSKTCNNYQPTYIETTTVLYKKVDYEVQKVVSLQYDLTCLPIYMNLMRSSFVLEFIVLVVSLAYFAFEKSLGASKNTRRALIAVLAINVVVIVLATNFSLDAIEDTVAVTHKGEKENELLKFSWLYLWQAVFNIALIIAAYPFKASTEGEEKAEEENRKSNTEAGKDSEILSPLVCTRKGEELV
eukprot:TRINITY_DN12802_c0_g1_i6.p1 TRINITY_DN12802_c0_g1~~TRINITY_DN12802_c0_g1_i6.p1  ORF type:complete len:238 (+),score=20.07 TRINITY_DN12802_c0_g1_i6:68-715(+)